MGLSSFNAMRARMKAEAKALGNSSANVEVKETKPEIKEPEEKVEVSEPIVEETVKDKSTKKTDAEKLKKKKE
jgi:hypothetical protein